MTYEPTYDKDKTDTPSTVSNWYYPYITGFTSTELIDWKQKYIELLEKYNRLLEKHQKD